MYLTQIMQFRAANSVNLLSLIHLKKASTDLFGYACVFCKRSILNILTLFIHSQLHYLGLTGNLLLQIGGILSFTIALLHLGIIFAGASGYRYFGAGEKMAEMAEADSFIPAMVTSAIVAAFTVFGFYAFSGAGIIPPLPFLKTGLTVISGIYILRGIVVVQQIFSMIKSPPSIETREMVFSLVSLVIGVIHILGTISIWRD